MKVNFRINSVIFCFLLSAFVLFQSCEKELCRKRAVEISGMNHTVDLKDLEKIKTIPELQSVLDKYPQLRVKRFIDDEYQFGIHCSQYYKGILVETEPYQVHSSKREKYVFEMGEIISAPSFSLTPNFSYLRGYDIVKKLIPLTSCYSYKLAIYDLNAGVSNSPKDFKLVWIYESLNNGSSAVIDAHTEDVYRAFDGIVF